MSTHTAFFEASAVRDFTNKVSAVSELDEEMFDGLFCAAVLANADGNEMAMDDLETLRRIAHEWFVMTATMGLFFQGLLRFSVKDGQMMVGIREGDPGDMQACLERVKQTREQSK